MGFSMLTSSVSPFPRVDPYWTGSDCPPFFNRTKRIYQRMKWKDELSLRGIYNPVLNNLAEVLPVGAYVAGGFVSSVLRMGDIQPSDIDIFFNGPEAFLKTYQLFTRSEVPDAAWSVRGYKTTVTPEDLETNSRKLKLVKLTSDIPDKLPVQLIKMMWFEDAEHVIDTFDFTTVQFAIDGETLVYNPLSFLDLAKQTLVSNRHHYPADTLYRMVKYVNKGYKVAPASMVHIAEEIRKSEVTDPPMLNRYYGQEDPDA